MLSVENKWCGVHKWPGAVETNVKLFCFYPDIYQTSQSQTASLQRPVLQSQFNLPRIYFILLD